MSWVNIKEKPITPVIDLDTDVVVYVPGYAVKGPGDPTLVNSDNFTTIFGESAFVCSDGAGASDITKNAVVDGVSEKSWIYAKGLVDAGLTVLYHRYISADAVYPSVSEAFTFEGASYTSGTINVRSKYAGVYYKGLVVSAEKVSNGVSRIIVKRDATVLETKLVSLNPEQSNYLGGTEFENIEIYALEGSVELNLSQLCEKVASTITNYSSAYIINNDGEKTLTCTENTDSFTVKSFETALSSPLCSILKDTERYPVSYITTGGYFLSTTQTLEIFKVAEEIKSAFAVNFSENLTDVNNYRNTLLSNLKVDNNMSLSQGFEIIGADTFVTNNYRILLPDSFGYFIRLGNNISAGYPYYVPVANNSMGTVSNAVSSSTPITYDMETSMIDDIGISINPVIVKKNVGYVIMGNRTLYPNDGVLGPQSFLNCRVVVNAVERAARTAANKLRIVSTNPETAFKNFRNYVEKTCDKLLTNGDGLAEYSIIKLPKTKPATIDIQIRLTVVEGIETWNLNIETSIALD